MSGERLLSWGFAGTVAIDGTSLHVPDSVPIAGQYPKRRGKGWFDYPLLRLVVLVETGTRAVLAASFGPDSTRGDGLRTQAAGRGGQRDAAAG